MRHFERIMPITVLIVINLAFGFLVGGVAWPAHLGGLVTSAIVAALVRRLGGGSDKVFRAVLHRACPHLLTTYTSVIPHL
ncbi:hypothetical protein QJS66_14520 [Kocuria rhizophila]|nr:hypothetical protein QJS66_14520 [Kocuria rhizophila]